MAVLLDFRSFLLPDTFYTSIELRISGGSQGVGNFLTGAFFPRIFPTPGFIIS